jgi:hypothetical protein
MALASMTEADRLVDVAFASAPHSPPKRR